MTTSPANQYQPENLQDQLSECQQRVDRLLADRLTAASAEAKLSEAMSYAVLGGGKRVRPVLVYGSCLAAGGALADADAAATAVELIHAYSLVHDDLPAMDNDDLRRGKPTVHKAFDDGIAILVGDGLQALAFRVLSDEQTAITAATQLRMLRVLSDAIGAVGMVGGQALDFAATG
ncbi:MAG: polyprenyl synthetase family protein, partial [Gammaproteobacteria bacterium]